jgi:hypothetical protein
MACVQDIRAPRDTWQYESFTTFYSIDILALICKKHEVTFGSPDTLHEFEPLPSAGTSKPSTQVHFKIDHLVAHRPKLSGNHSRLDKGPRLALLRPAYGSAPIAVPRRVRGAAVEGFRAAASLDSSAPYPYHVGSGRPWS